MTDFDKQVKEAVELLKKDLTEAAANTFKKVCNNIINDTPTDSGTLQGNWQTSKGSPEGGTTSRKGDVGPKAEVESTIKDPGVYYMTNNLPYASGIEYDGDSDDAPGGMVRKNALKFKSILKDESA
jgi:hypothetical protein